MRQIMMTIDRKRVRCAEGETILAAARRHGVYIPSLCSHEALQPYGACRLCMVEVGIGRDRRLAAACTTAVRTGMRVRTRTPQIDRLRRILVGLLAARCPDAPVVRQLVRDLGAARMPAPAATDLCIQCGLCVRACRDITGAAALCFAGRGRTRCATVAFLRDSQECVGCGSCVLVCPTGAVRLRDEARPDGTVRVMETWNTELPVQRCPEDGEDMGPARLREHVAARRPVAAGFLERCPSCRTGGATGSQR